MPQTNIIIQPAVEGYIVSFTQRTADGQGDIEREKPHIFASLNEVHDFLIENLVEKPPAPPVPVATTGEEFTNKNK